MYTFVLGQSKLDKATLEKEIVFDSSLGILFASLSAFFLHRAYKKYKQWKKL